MFFWTQFALKRGHYGPHPRRKKFFFARNNKSRSSAFRKFFILSKYHMFWLSYESFSILSDVSVKRVSFPAKTAVAVHYFLHAFLSDYFCFACQICVHAQFFGKIKTNATHLYCTKALLICLENGFLHSVQVCFLFPKVETLE